MSFDINMQQISKKTLASQGRLLFKKQIMLQICQQKKNNWFLITLNASGHCVFFNFAVFYSFLMWLNIKVHKTEAQQISSYLVYEML